MSKYILEQAIVHKKILLYLFILYLFQTIKIIVRTIENIEYYFTGGRSIWQLITLP